MKRRTIITSVLVIVLCLGLISGSTFALFTSTSSVNIAVTSGKVKVNATLSTPILYSANASEITTYGKAVKTTDTTSDGADGTLTGTFAGTYYYKSVTDEFLNGGTASYTAPTLTIDKMTPGDKVKTTLSVGNKSNVAIQYRLKIEATSTSNDVLSLLKIDYDGKLYTGLKSFTSTWTKVDAPTSTTTPMVTKDISIIFPLDIDGEEYMNKTVGFVFTVEAVQSNANTSGATTIEFATSAGTSTATAQTLTATAAIPTTTGEPVTTPSTATTEINDANNVATTSIPVSTKLYTDDAVTGESITITAEEGTTGALSRTIDVVPTSPTSTTVDISFTYTETNTTTQESKTTAVTGFDKIVTNTANIGVNLMSVTVTRSHNGQVTQMTESDDPTVEGFSYNPDTGVLTIRSKLYSEYCVNYKLAVAYNLNNTSESYLNVEQLHAALVAGKSVKLLSDLDMTGYTWEPIEDYTGTFDGNKKTISNLSISSPSGIGAMFGSVGDNATIKDVKFTHVTIAGKHAATVVGDAETALNLTMTGIEVLSGNITATNYAAGIVFDAEGNGVTMSNCKNYATITAGFSASGIGAWVYSNGTFDHLENYGDVTGGNRAGGIFANFAGTISNSINKGNVTSTGDMPVGGIVGVIGGATTFNHCINTGDVTNSYASSNSNAAAGGILGHNPGSNSVTINYCVNTGDITALNSVAGGIGTALYGSTFINYSYNSGDVSGNLSGNKITAGGIMPKPEYGATSTAYHCINSGTVTAGNNNFNYLATSCDGSYYYDNGLKNDSGDPVDDIEAVVASLNGGQDHYFWVINNNVIVPAILVEE